MGEERVAAFRTGQEKCSVCVCMCVYVCLCLQVIPTYLSFVSVTYPNFLRDFFLLLLLLLLSSYPPKLTSFISLIHCIFIFSHTDIILLTISTTDTDTDLLSTTDTDLLSTTDTDLLSTTDTDLLSTTDTDLLSSQVYTVVLPL